MFKAPLTLGVEEEYQIIDPVTRKLTSYVQQMMNRGRVVLGDQVKHEFLQSQIEVGSHICHDIHEVEHEIKRLRKTVYSVAQEYGRVIAASSTHPFSRWEDQEITEGERYQDLETKMQDVGRQLLIFGTHVHIGFGKSSEAREAMIDVMNQFRYFLPHILALSTSSPFWNGRDTGLKSYRSIIFKSLPRTGIPPVFNSFHDFHSFAHLLGKVGTLGYRDDGSADYTKIWWDARPHYSLGTLEIRVSDMCTKLEEAVCIAAFVQAIAAKLLRLKNKNKSWRIYRSNLIEENKWRAVRYGLDGRLIDFGRSEDFPIKDVIRELLISLSDEIDELGIRKEIEYVDTIFKEGSSADRQLAVFYKALKDGADRYEAFNRVVDHVVAETVQGVL